MAVLASFIFKRSLPFEFHKKIYVYIFYLRILLYTDQIVHYDFLDLYRF